MELSVLVASGTSLLVSDLNDEDPLETVFLCVQVSRPWVFFLMAT